MGMEKWKSLGHLKAASLQHSYDLQVALGGGNMAAIHKELADFVCLAILAGTPEALIQERLKKFYDNGSLPPLG